MSQTYNFLCIIPPLTLLILTRFGLPVSTTFLILTFFEPKNLVSMVSKSLMGYGLALVVGIAVFFAVKRALQSSTNENTAPPAEWWTALQWLSTAFLWSQWLIQDLANLFIYFPRYGEKGNQTLPLTWLLIGLGIMLVMQILIFKDGGGKIQEIVNQKSQSNDVREATPLVSSPIAQISVFETGANRWRFFAQWPPKKAINQTLYFTQNETLTWESKQQKGKSSYPSNPHKPVPQSSRITSGWEKEFMVEDQRLQATRPDVLVFNSPIQDTPLTLAGPIDISAWVSTDQEDLNLIVKVIDVSPSLDLNRNKAASSERGNRHELVRWGVMRARFRKSLSQPTPLTPHQPTLLKFKIYDLFHTFKVGHRLQIQIQSSFFPFLEVNPQKYIPNLFEATQTDFTSATHTLFHSSTYPSQLKLTVLP